MMDETDISKRKDNEHRLEILHGYASRMSKAVSEQEIADILYQTIFNVLGISRGSFGLVQGDNLNLTYRWNMITSNPVLMSLNGPGITVRAVTTGQTQLINDVTKDKDYFTTVPNINDKSYSELVVPITIKEIVIAVINVESTELNAFSEADKNLLEIFAGHVSSALQRIQAQKEIERVQNEKIRETINTASRISSQIRHDIRAPLLNINQSIQLLREAPNDYPELWEIVERNIQYINLMLEDIKIDKLANQLEKIEVNVRSLVDNSLGAILVPDIIHISNEVPSKLTWKLDPVQMERALHNIINNAIEAIPEKGEIVTQATAVEGKLVIEIKDTGIGIPSEKQSHLFQPFYTTKPKGMGLGLLLIKQIVDAHEGKIEIESEENKGTIVRISIQ